MDASTPVEAPDVLHIWPDCLRVWGIWQRIQTLWRCGMGWREGLDYAGLIAYLQEVERIKPRQFADVFTCLQAMERAALEEWAKQREQK